jgi:hypothetical protein
MMSKKGLYGKVTNIRQSQASKKRGFFKAQWDALKYGPGGRGGPTPYRWDIRVLDKDGRTWSVAMKGYELEGVIEIGDTIFVPGKWKPGKLIECTKLINETVGGIEVEVK